MKKNSLNLIASLIGVVALFLYNTKVYENTDFSFTYYYGFYSDTTIFTLNCLAFVVSVLSIIIGFGMSISGIINKKDCSIHVFLLSLVNVLMIYGLLTKKGFTLSDNGILLIVILSCYIILSFLSVLINALTDKQKDQKLKIEEDRESNN